MKRSLFIKTKFINRKGSATVMALLFLLFFTIIGVAWAAMMNMESTSSAADKDEQQAWYAAESGVKKAQVELLNQNTKWSWLATTVTGTDNYVALANDAQYRVCIYYFAETDTTKRNPIFLSSSKSMVTGSGSTTYIIKSIGKYKDSTRTLSKEYTITIKSS